MSALVLVLVLTIGFIYTSRDLDARYRQKKSTGWDSYCHIAMWGFWFWFVGALMVLLVWVLFWVSSTVLNLPEMIGFADYTPFAWHDDFYHGVFLGKSVPVLASLFCGALAAFGQANASAQKLSDPEKRLAALERVVASDGLQSLLIQSMKEHMLVLLTMKSRKVYVGYIQELGHEQVVQGNEDIVILPLISGFRDKDNLVFHQLHNYVGFYSKHQIGPDSKPLSLNHFRVVLPREQIESASLFDAGTFLAFQQIESNGAEILAVK